MGEVLPDLNCAQVQDATIKIQSAYRGFKTRKEMEDIKDDLPDLNAADVATATLKIQSAYKGFKTRKMIKERKDFNCSNPILSEVKKIKSGKEVKDLPDITAPEFARAAMRIQAYFRGFKVRQASRKQIRHEAEAFANVAAAALLLKIDQGEKPKPGRKMPKTPAQSIDIPDDEVQRM